MTTGVLLSLFIFVISLSSYVFCGASESADFPSISHVSLLLPEPLGEFPVAHTLNATGGCFKWEVEDNSVVTLVPVEQQPMGGKSCVSAVSVRSLQRFRDVPTSTRIRAKDIFTGENLNCVVVVDSIKTIKIETKRRIVYKDEPEIIQISAWDTTGNLFTTVEGLQFDWKIRSLHSSGVDVLQLVSFEQGSVHASPVIIGMQKKGKLTSSIMLLGVEPGKAELSVELHGHPEVPNDLVVLQVVQRLLLQPALAQIVAPGTEIHYILQVKSPKEYHPSTIPMPDSSYEWISDNPNVASIDNTGKAKTKELGATKITARDKVSDSWAEANIYVVAPDSLHLKISSFDHEIKDNWVLCVGKKYFLDIEVTEANGNLLNTEQMLFDTKINSKYFTMEYSSSNMAHFVVIPLAVGTVPIQSKLQRIGNIPNKFPLQSEEEAILTHPVSITPSILRLPLNSPSHEYTFKVIGGSGSYHFASSNTAVAVDQKGVVSGIQLGNSEISVSDIMAPENSASSFVYVDSVSSLEFLSSPVETVEGGTLTLEVIAKTRDGKEFSNCSSLQLSWQLIDSPESFTLESEIQTTKRSKGSCGGAILFAQKVGTNSLQCSFKNEASVTTRLYSFPPVKIFPASALVTVGSSYTFSYEGGPSPWKGETASFFERVSPSFPSNISVATFKGKSAPKLNISVTCLQLGKQTISLTVGNEKAHDHPFPFSLSDTFTFECLLPSNLLLSVDTNENEPYFIEGCPFATAIDDYAAFRNTVPLPKVFQLLSNKEYSFVATIISEKGIAFDNCSSLLLTWISEGSFAWQGKEKFNRVLSLSNEEASLMIRVIATRFDEKFLNLYNIKNPPSLSAPSLSRELQINFVPNVVISPTKVTLFNNERFYRKLTVRHGSGKFGFVVDDPSIISSKQSGLSVDLLALKPGRAKLSVSDVCLPRSSAAHSEVTVIDVTHLSFHEPGPYYLQIGQMITLNISAFDQLQQAIPFEFYDFLKLRPDIQPMDRLDFISWINPLQLRLQAQTIGDATVSVSYPRRDGTFVKTPPINIHCFPPLELLPKRVVLLPDTTFPMKISGGPPSSEIRFTISDETIAEINQNGLLKTKKPGVSEISARALVQNKEYSKAESSLNVKNYFENIEMKLHADSKTYVVGSLVMIWAEFVSFPEALTFPTSESFRIHWTSSDTSVVALKSIYSPAGVSVEAELPISVHLNSLAPGISKITATLELESKPKISANIVVNVVEPLRFLHSSSILMSPRTAFQIRTNKERDLSFSLLSGEATQSLVIEKTGILRSLGVVGSGVVLVSDGFTQQALLVEVKHPSSVRVSPSLPLYQIPVQGTIHFNLEFLDQSGRPFDTVNTKYTLTTNNEDVVALPSFTESGSFQLSGKAPGHALIRVGTESEIKTFFKVEVPAPAGDAKALYVHVGGQINFPLMDPSPGDWVSDKPSVLSVESRGIASAHVSGVAIVTNTGSLFPYRVTVSKIGDIAIVPQSAKFLSNLPIFRVPIMFEAAGAPNTFLSSGPANTISHNIVFECVTESPITAKAFFDTDTGNYYCDLEESSLHQQTTLLTVFASDKSKTYQKERKEIVNLRKGFTLINIPNEIRLTSGRRSHQGEVITSSSTFTISSPVDSPVGVRTRRISPSSLMLEIFIKDDSFGSFDNILLSFSDPAEPQQYAETLVSFDDSVFVGHDELEEEEGKGTSNLFLGLLVTMAFILSFLYYRANFS